LSLRNKIWEIVEVGKAGGHLSRKFDSIILCLVLLNFVAVIACSVNSIADQYGAALNLFELLSVLVFTIEYVARIYSCTADPKFHSHFMGRVRFVLSPMAIIDLLAILPFFLPFIGIGPRYLRVLRLLRISGDGENWSLLYFFKNNKMRFQSKREELVLSTVMMGLLLVISSSLLYYCENTAQPDKFSSIPATMWFSVATLTTVGYGDMYPVTFLSKICASVVAIIGIGMFALPTGILGAGFVEVLQNKRSKIHCPHCGGEVDRI
jgi:voltage-gated potassium channel